ncbi:hypothetical protein DH2020_029238 [Rehmannia glutinosa]|uniref:C2 domain-containing protein n=1 Tax=Rehmannia glutinosa TaxID=99300 RepID=A0ABR0VSS5_REHGL
MSISGIQGQLLEVTDGGKNPTFQEKFVFTLIEGLREFSVVVWNSNTLTFDDFIGTGKIQLQKVLSQGYDDSAWPLQDKRGRSQQQAMLHQQLHQLHRMLVHQRHKFLSTRHLHQEGLIRQRAILHHLFILKYAPNAGYPPSPYHQPPAYPPTYPPTSSYPPHSAYPRLPTTHTIILQVRYLAPFSLLLNRIC